MRILMLLAIVPTILAAATGRVERVNFDLGAPSRQIAITATEGLDTSIEASIRRDGALFDVRDWTVLLWYGTASTNPPIGLAFTNTASGRGWSRWDINGAMLATNGRFDVQIVASHPDGTIQEWARGYMTIHADSTSTFQPVTFGAPLHAVSNALATAIAAEALARESGDAVGLTNWQAVVYSLTNGAALGETALQPSWAATGHVATAGYAEYAAHATGADWAAEATDAGRAATADFATEAEDANFATTAMLAENATFADFAAAATEAGSAHSLTPGMDDAIALAAATAHTNSPAAHPDIRAAIDAIPLPPTNAVAGWFVWDSGSNVFWRVSATNLRFYVWP